jgi:hypothetical protein
VKLPVAKKASEFIAFQGGLDVVSPMAVVPPGFAKAAVNVEEDINGGYATIKGYERFDGRPSPSDADYYVLSASAKGTVAVGDTITGASSGATAVVIAITDDAFIVTKPTGTWGSENTTAGGATVTSILVGGFTGATDAQYKNLAADVYRDDIAAVPGEGVVLGVWYYKGVVYAFRNKAGASAGVGMYKSSGSGWQAVSLGYEIGFSNANASVSEGDTLIKGGVTATINRVVVESGTLVSGVNTGRLIISAPSGGNFSAGAATSAGGGSLTLSGAQSEITIPNKNGRFEFVNANFAGAAGTQRIYGADGVNQAFEFDGTVFVPINVGPGIYPQHLAAHQNHLFVSYLSSVLHSGIGDPYNWTTTAGAGEIALSDEVTGMIPQPGSETTGAMALYCRNRTTILYGTDASNWNNINYNDDSGAIPYSMQRMGDTFVLDDRGVATLRTAQEFGNFAQSTISKRVKSWITAKRSLLTDSHVARDKGQYRLFFSDGAAAYWTVDKDRASMMPMQFAHNVLCSVSAETYGGGDEVIYFGSDDGMVYQMEKGTSFDGEAIDWYMELVFNHSKLYRALKKYRRMTFELSGEGYCVFYSTYSLSYGASDTAQPGETVNTISMLSASWDDGSTWDQFFWDGVNLTPMSMELSGDGENISIRIAGSSDYFSRTKFSGVFLEYSPLRMLR